VIDSFSRQVGFDIIEHIVADELETMYRWDVDHPHGRRGHWFARLTKLPTLR
jgi:hypothetical protein